MDSIVGWGNAALIVLGVISLLAVTVVGFKASFNTARVSALREDNGDLRSRVDDLDKELVRQKAREEAEVAKRKAIEARVHHLESENELLKDMVLQRTDITTLTEAMEDHENYVRKEIDAMKVMLKEIRDAVGE